MQVDINMMGRLRRAYTYFGDDNEPTMVINNDDRRRSALIPLDCAFKYDEPQRYMGEMGLIAAVGPIARALQLPEDPRHLAKLANFIADGLDDLIKMKPFSMTEKGQKPIVGEYDAYLNGQRFSGDMEA